MSDSAAIKGLGSYLTSSFREFAISRGLTQEIINDYAALKAERDALAAENAALKKFFSVGISAAFEGCDWYGGDIQGKALELGLIREEKYDHETHAESVFNPEDFQQGDIVFTINETPATTTYLNSVRAEGVEMFGSALKDKYEGIAYELIGNYETNGEEDRISDEGEIQEVFHFAAQLRAGAPS